MLPFQPPRLLRNPHVQGLASRLPMRKRRILREAADLLDAQRSLLLHGGDAQLQAWWSPQPDPHTRPRSLVALLHGWEGSSESLYLLATATRLYAAGFDVLRLNFRDHGDSHHLNAGLFHSCREDEVALALQDAVQRLQPDWFALAGFSLGGNFALRVAPRLPTRAVFAVCPVRDPDHTLDALETGPALYRQYFLRKWRDSLRRKAGVFPEQYRADAATRFHGLADMTEQLVIRHAGFSSLHTYLRGYAITDARLADLPCPTQILISADDPVIPVSGWRSAICPAQVELRICAHGGHCGFVADWRLGDWIEPEIAGWLSRQHAQI